MIIVVFLLILFIGVLVLYAQSGAKLKHKGSRSVEAVNLDDFNYRDSFNIAGVNKHGASLLDQGTWKGWVARDNENRYDKNAIAVFMGQKHIGYLSKAIAAKYAARIDKLDGQVPAIVQLENKVDEEDGHRYIVGRVQILWPDTE